MNLKYTESLPSYMGGLTNIKNANTQQYQWLYEHGCKHRHRYSRHFGCFLKEFNIKERIGFLDIETSNLKANFGIVLCWCINNTYGLVKDWLTKKDVLSGDEDKRVVQSCIDAMRGYDRIVTHYGCLTPGHRVLTASLKWVDVATLKQGDKLLSFSKARPRVFQESIVIHNIPVKQNCYKITVDDGTTLTATENHPFLVKDGTGAGRGHYRWRTVEQLYKALPSKIYKGGLQFNRILPVWDTVDTYEAGWLAGFLDGEGTLCQNWYESNWQPHYSFIIGAAQNDNIVLKQAEAYLENLGIKFTTSTGGVNPKLRHINLLGGKGDKLQLLGSIRPTKLLEKLDINKLGSLRNTVDLKKITRIVDIKPVGEQVVCGLGTTTETYFSEGFASHNTYFDIPFLRTRALIHGLDFPKEGELYHTDTWKMAKRSLCLHSNRQDVIAESLYGKTVKTRISHPDWRKAMLGDEKAIAEVVDHCDKDVIDLKKNYNTLLPYCKIIRSSI